MHFDVLITFIFSSLVLTISPGPDIIYVISQSLVKGKKAAIITSLGLTTGLLFHTFFVVIGLSVLISENENIFFFTKDVRFFLFYLFSIYGFFKEKK